MYIISISGCADDADEIVALAASKLAAWLADSIPGYTAI